MKRFLLLYNLKLNFLIFSAGINGSLIIFIRTYMKSCAYWFSLYTHSILGPFGPPRQCRMHIGFFRTQYSHYWLLHPEPYEIGSSTFKEYLRRPNMTVVVIYVYTRVLYGEPIVTVLTIIGFLYTEAV